MNTLRLENINLHAPYRVLQDPERHNNFYFVSDSGASSRGDRYLSHSSRHTQVPVPATTVLQKNAQKRINLEKNE